MQTTRDDEPVRGFESRKALALLGYLAAQDRAVPREQLVDLFWGDKSESRGRANLSWVLNRIATLLPDCLQADRHDVRFQRAAQYWLDIDAFAQLETQRDPDSLAAALAQYETCRNILAQELGVEPLPETTALYERIQAATQARKPNLPVQPTRFVGREEDLAQVASMLNDPECRLLTILGPGGVGKTRLALQAVADQTEAFLEGVFFAPLAPLSAAEHLTSAIAEAVGFSFSGQDAPKQQPLNYLRGKEMLLILDNFEHLLERAEFIVEILRKAPEITLLVTSRARLNVEGEHLFPVAGGDSGYHAVQPCRAVPDQRATGTAKL